MPFPRTSRRGCSRAPPLGGAAWRCRCAMDPIPKGVPSIPSQLHPNSIQCPSQSHLDLADETAAARRGRRRLIPSRWIPSHWIPSRWIPAKRLHPSRGRRQDRLLADRLPKPGHCVSWTAGSAVHRSRDPAGPSMASEQEGRFFTPVPPSQAHHLPHRPLRAGTVALGGQKGR